MTFSKGLFPKRKRTSNNSSDGEDTHFSKRNAPPGGISRPDNMKSPANLASDSSLNQKNEQRRGSTLSWKIIPRIMGFLCRDSRRSEPCIDTETTKGYPITEIMKKMIMLCAVRRIEKARRAGKANFDLEKIVSSALDWMENLTHQDHCFNTKCYNGGPSDFRERLEWADFNVRLAVEQLEQEAEVEAKNRKLLEKAEEEASQSPKQHSSQEATLSPDEKEHTKQNAAEEATQSRSIPEQTTAHINGPASGQRFNVANISYTAARPTSDEWIRQLQLTRMHGSFETREAASAPSLPSASHTHLPSYHELKASVDARTESPRATARAQLAYRAPLPSSSPLTLDTPVSPLTSTASVLSTTPPHDEFALRMLPPPVPLAPKSPPTVSPDSQSFTTTRHHGPSDYHPSGPTNPFAPAVRQRDASPPPSFRRHERRGAIWQLPTTAFLFQAGTSQGIPVPSVESATASSMQSVYSPAPAPAPSRRVARYRAQIAPEIEAHFNGASTLRSVMTSPRRWFRGRSDESCRKEDENRR